MIRSAASKVMWVGRATVFLVGLAVILALVLGAATTALSATGGNFILGQPNSADAPTTLTWTGNTDISKAALVLKNLNGGNALQLKVGDGIAPMTVNSGAKVAKLNADRIDNREAGSFADGVGGVATNADKLDGKDSAAFAPRSQLDATQVMRVNGPLPRSGTFTSHGGTLVVTATGSGYRASANTIQSQGNIGMLVNIREPDGSSSGNLMGVFTNELDSHKAFVSEERVIDNLPAGTYTVELEAAYDGGDFGDCNKTLETQQTYCTTTDGDDRFNVTVVELPK